MNFKENALALYKQGPARITAVGDKISIALPSGSSKNVREKDITLLHPGPIRDFGILQAKPEGDIDGAFELLEGEATTLADFAELAFDEFTPDTAWATWRIVADDVLFDGTPDELTPRPQEKVDAIRAKRAEKAAAKQAWEDMIARIRDAKIIDEDRKALQEVEILANKREGSSKIMQALGLQQTPQQAHSLLLKLKIWSDRDNPHVRRRGLALTDPDVAVPELPDEERLDLTHLECFAIDDEHSTDPDDAIGIDGDRIWVHVADVGALVQPDDELDLTARERGTNLYLPEGTVHMLPPAVTEQLALGLAATSPALSFAIRLDDSGEVADVEIALTRIKVTRISYAEANEKLDQAPFSEMRAILDRFRAKRRARGSAKIALPEVAVRVRDDEISIKPLPSLDSREMVADAMLLAGEAVGRYALEHHLVFPYSTQAPPETPSVPETMSQMYDYRRQFKRSQMRTEPAPHFGLGLEIYSQVTSPLRRYLDLVCHQQLRAHLKGERGVSGEGLMERVAAAENSIDDMRRTERDSVLHWKLAWLLRQKRKNGEWRGKGTVVAHRGKRGIVIIPELALEAGISGLTSAPLDSEVELIMTGVDFPDQLAKFRTA